MDMTIIIPKNGLKGPKFTNMDQNDRTMKYFSIIEVYLNAIFEFKCYPLFGLFFFKGRHYFVLAWTTTRMLIWHNFKAVTNKN